jgi:hypothetical protein
MSLCRRQSCGAVLRPEDENNNFLVPIAWLVVVREHQLSKHIARGLK